MLIRPEIQAHNTHASHLFFSVGCLVKSNSMANATCYYPNGSIAPEDTPCHPPATGDSVSACCLDSHLCLDNGLCLPQDGAERLYRGSCTDRIWQSTECAQYCPDGNNHIFGKVWISVQKQLPLSLAPSRWH